MLRPEPMPPPPSLAKQPPSIVKSHKELVPALIRALKDSDAEVRESAATALENLGGEALLALVAALQRKDNAVSGAEAIKSGSKASNATSKLIRALEDKDVVVRRQAARALASRVRDLPTPDDALQIRD
jgi:HEAT repeat protein